MVSQSESLFFFSRETHDEDCHKYVDSWHYWALLLYNNGDGDVLEEGVVGLGRKEEAEGDCGV